MSRRLVKLFALFGTFLLPFICTLLPYKVSGYIANKGASGKRLLSYLMCLGGGIFFGTYLLHMGPEVQTILRDSLLEPYEITYPVAELIVGIGFFIVLFGEKLVLRWNKRRIRMKRSESCRPPTSTAVSSTCLNGAESSRGKCSRPLSEEMCPECIDGRECHGGEKRRDGDGVEVAQHRVHQNDAPDVDASSHLLSQPVADAADNPTCATSSASFNCQKSDTGDHCSSPSTQHQEASRKDRQTDVTVTIDNTSLKLKSEEFDMETGSVREHSGHHHHATRSVVLILALSLHRIFEGMTIGLQHSVTNVASLFGAVMCHEMVIGFSLGLQFVRSGFAFRRLLITSLVCSLIMPLGVLIGLVMTEVESGDGNIDIANGILQAIAMGTFIYVTFFEILREEVDSADTSLGKIVCIAAGFALMALLNLIPEGPIGTSSPRHMNASTAVPPVNATLMA